ncbi:MAG: beta-glucanase (GH16 family) [Saprospiraceae bacterium]|jgi:beta-glucanase (GH16 family)
MKKTTLNILGILSIILGGSVFSCSESDTDKTDSATTELAESDPHSITIEAESFTGYKGKMKTEGSENGEKFVTTPAEDSWLAYEVNVIEAGRYTFEINATTLADSTTVWMEDYTDNTDGRTYNITGSIPISASGDAFSIFSKDGSPLNTGIHKMKLHVKGGSVKVDWLKFNLLKKHQLTPKTLTQKTDGKDWKVVWSDEFDGEGLPDTSKWTYDIGDWGWGNNELQYYTENRGENARQENGNLIIEARKNDWDQEWTSARLTTRGKVTFLYGKIEFKANVPRERGNWAAGWTLGDSYVDELSWPYCGEIDIMESVGYEVDDKSGDGIAHCTVHTPAYYFKINNQISSVKDILKIAGEFHTYSVEWTPTEIKGFVDGKEYYLYDKIADEREWPFAQPQNIILNLAMGGGWGGAQGMDESVTAQQLIIDYVRVYERQ